jgi:AAA domain
VSGLDWAALVLAKDPEAAKGLALGLPVPRSRLREEKLRAIGEPLTGPDIVLDDELALRLELHRNGDEQAEAQDEHAHSWQALDLVELGAKPPEPPAVGGLFYLGRRHVVSGEAEAGKSMLMLALAAAELLEARGVIWVDTDDMGAGPVLEVLRAHGVDDQRIRGLFAYLRPEEAATPIVREYLAALIRYRSVRLIVFDTFNSSLVLHGLDPVSTVEVERFFRQVVNPLSDLGPAVVLTDHVVKRADDRGKYAYGSERKHTAADVHLGMKPIETLGRGRRGRSKLTVHKDRPGFLERPSPGAFVLDSDEESGRVSWRIEPDHDTGDDGAWRPTGYMEKVSRYLERVQEPQSRNQIEKGVPGKAEHIRIAIDRLLSEEFAVQFKGEHGAHLVRLLGIFRESGEWAE